jgi:hypothetical protein
MIARALQGRVHKKSTKEKKKMRPTTGSPAWLPAAGGINTSQSALQHEDKEVNNFDKPESSSSSRGDEALIDSNGITSIYRHFSHPTSQNTETSHRRRHEKRDSVVEIRQPSSPEAYVPF